MEVFLQRLTVRRDEMRQLYTSLYHDVQTFDAFCGMLEEQYAARKESLRALDAVREQRPDWYRDRSLLGMLMYTQCFGGTLKGVAGRLDYLRETGVNYIHLMPLLESPADRSDGGYAVADYTRVQPELGTMEDLEALAAACHERGMSVCLDFVMNHTSEDHAWAKAARAGDAEAQARYFFFDDWTVPNEYEKTVPQVFPQTAPGNFSWCEEAGKVVMTTFWPYQWDLNYGNPAVLRDMTALMLNLCNKGIDVIRLDATPYIWKELGTPCRNLPQVHTLVRLMRLACEVVCPGTLLLGEVVMEPSKVVPYFGSPDKPECHMLYNVTTMATTWHTVATADVRLMRHQLAGVFALPHAYTFLNYLRCHDDIGWGLDYPFLARFGMQETPHKQFLNDYFRGRYGNGMARGELYNDDPRLGDARLCGTTASLCGIEGALETGDPAALARAVALDVMLHAFLLIQSGIPVLYSGDEVAQLNDPGYHADPIKREDSRYLHRGIMDWQAAARRSDASSYQGRVYQGIRQLEAIRRGHAVFSPEADLWLPEVNNDHVLAIGRYYRGEKLIALFNFSPDDQWIPWPEGDGYTDALTGEPHSSAWLKLDGYAFRWLIRNV